MYLLLQFPTQTRKRTVCVCVFNNFKKNGERERADPHCHLLLPGAQTHQRIVGCTPFTQGAVWFRKTKNESRAEAQGQLKAFNVLPSRREHRLPQPTRVPAKPLPHPTTQRPQRVTTRVRPHPLSPGTPGRQVGQGSLSQFIDERKPTR